MLFPVCEIAIQEGCIPPPTEAEYCQNGMVGAVSEYYSSIHHWIVSPRNRRRVNGGR
jgi:hypothetical protein